jgi:hypothetical protein
MTRASGYARVVNDWYVEPEWVVASLLTAEQQFTGTCWDPACGGGTIPKTVAKMWPRIAPMWEASDIVDRGYGRQVDFFDFSLDKHVVNNIVSNPPYRLIEPFVHRALSLTKDRVCVLARLAFLESMRRVEFFREVPLARVWVSTRRVSMPPGGTGIKAAGGSVAYAWFVFSHHHYRGRRPELGWI